MAIKPDYTAMADQELFERYHWKGQTEAFDVLFARHSSSVMRFVGGMLGPDSAYVDDVFQETWLRMINHGDKWHGGNFRAWLITIARNATIDLLRRLKPTLSLDVENEDGERWGDTMVSGELAPDHILEGQETEAMIAELVLKLPELQREVFLMRVTNQMSFNAIAEALKIPLNTALGRMHYAVKKLRAELDATRDDWQTRRIL